SGLPSNATNSSSGGTQRSPDGGAAGGVPSEVASGTSPSERYSANRRAERPSAAQARRERKARPAGSGCRAPRANQAGTPALRSDFQRRAEVLHGQRIGRGNDGQHVAGTPRQGRDEVALERALQGEIGKEKRMPEDGMLDAVADPLARESEDRGAVGEAGPGKLRFVDAEKVRQLG